MTDRDVVRIAVQSSGRLSERSLELLDRCGFDFERRHRLTWKARDFPLEIMLIRHDDIPEYVIDGVCDLGLVGINALQERVFSLDNGASAEIVLRLGFGQCRLCLAVPFGQDYDGPASLNGRRIATSYPAILAQHLAAAGVEAKIVTISGSVELAPALGIADCVCDLVSTGKTLHDNGLGEVETVLDSESVLVKTARPLAPDREATVQRIVQRIDGVLKAARRKYIMMHAPTAALDEIKALFPGMEEPTILPLGNRSDKVVMHAVTEEGVFWETMERLKEAGASSILVLPIEKLVD